jgi:hypothetical protein
MADEDGFGTDLRKELHKPPKLLPIAQLEESVLYAIETYAITIIVSRRRHSLKEYRVTHGYR